MVISHRLEILCFDVGSIDSESFPVKMIIGCIGGYCCIAGIAAFITVHECGCFTVFIS